MKVANFKRANSVEQEYLELAPTNIPENTVKFQPTTSTITSLNSSFRNYTHDTPSKRVNTLRSAISNGQSSESRVQYTINKLFVDSKLQAEDIDSAFDADDESDSMMEISSNLPYRDNGKSSDDENKDDITATHTRTNSTTIGENDPKILTVNERLSKSESEDGYNSSDEHEKIIRIDKIDLKKERNFENMLRRQEGLRIMRVKEDGACLFRAIAYHIFENQERHDDLRNACIEYLSQNRVHFENFITEDFDHYLSRKRQKSCFVPLSIDPSIQISNSNQIFEPIRISYHFNNHYNAIIDELESSKPNSLEENLAAWPVDIIEGTSVIAHLPAPQIDLQEPLEEEFYIQPNELFEENPDVLDSSIRSDSMESDEFRELQAVLEMSLEENQSHLVESHLVLADEYDEEQELLAALENSRREYEMRSLKRSDCVSV
ncbi:OTU domain-containing protein 5 [Nowakowskiella sp. JEL0078]|nr:OTU domain-containing protein 5 [Nowakowskiella sp. JEL0078]